LRGKRLGFSLKDIQDYLSLYDVDPTQTAQVAKLVELVDARMTMLAQQMDDLKTTLSELTEIRNLATDRLSATTSAE
jgi:DNA-binding transcriptional MerR regulator